MTMITPSYLGETIEYSSLHACRSTLEDPSPASPGAVSRRGIRENPGDPFGGAARGSTHVPGDYGRRVGIGSAAVAQAGGLPTTAYDGIARLSQEPVLL